MLPVTQNTKSANRSDIDDDKLMVTQGDAEVPPNFIDVAYAVQGGMRGPQARYLGTYELAVQPEPSSPTNYVVCLANGWPYWTKPDNESNKTFHLYRATNSSSVPGIWGQWSVTHESEGRVLDRYM